MTDGPVVITQRDIYDMLVDLKAAVESMSSLPERVSDHESRIRDIEAREDLTRRVAGMELQLVELQRKVWAIPGASVVIAAAAIILTLVRTY